MSFDSLSYSRILIVISRDQGTDVVDILAGRVIPLRLGYVPVVNRGQRDIDTSKSISAALEAERNFFEMHPSYKGKSQYCGTPFLARKLNMVRSRLLFPPYHNLMDCFRSSCNTFATPSQTSKHG